jgi:ribosome maturation factor RimP
MQMTLEKLQDDVEQTLAAAEPEVELLACEPAGRDRLRLVIDHPKGVDLELCERVTGHLRHLLADYEAGPLQALPRPPREAAAAQPARGSPEPLGRAGGRLGSRGHAGGR